MSRSRPTTPIRRISHGSLSSSAHRKSSLSGRQAKPGASSDTPLSFLTQAMGDLAYETSTMQANLEAVHEIQGALQTFDESFSMFLYGLKMNAFCVEWPEAPREEHFERAKQREYGMHTASQNDTDTLRNPYQNQELHEDNSDAAQVIAADQTYMTQDDDEATVTRARPSSASHNQQSSVLKSAMKRQHHEQPGARESTQPVQSAPKGRITAAEKKRRETIASEIIESMPLEYRGQDVTLQQLAKKIILALIASGAKGVRINELTKSPDLPLGKVNKCMIALVAAKQIVRRSDNGVVYQLDPNRHAGLLK